MLYRSLKSDGARSACNLGIIITVGSFPDIDQYLSEPEETTCVSNHDYSFRIGQ